MSTCIGFRVSRRPAARPGEAPRIPPKSRTSSTTRVGTPHSSKRSIARCQERWQRHGCDSRRQGIQTVEGCLSGLRTALLTIACSISETPSTVRSNARNPEIEFFQRAFETMRQELSARESAPEQRVSEHPWREYGPSVEHVRRTHRPRQHRVRLVVVLEALLDRIPVQLAIGLHRDVMQQARRAGAVRDLDRRDRLAPRADAFEPVAVMVGALVEMDLAFARSPT